MTLKIVKAQRRRVPMLISIAGVSGSGKTYSALLLAAGMAGGGGVGLLDTENGRGSMYADSPGIIAALPNGYNISELREPFSPARYIEAVDAFENSGASVLVIDSATHEWNGYGGCEDIAHKNLLGGLPNWALAKREHKRMMNRILASNMDIIICLRAQEKTAVVKNDKGKDTFVSKGVQAIQEKNFIFEMTLSMLLEEQTHKPIITKCPEPLVPLFSGEQALITKQNGEKLRAWAQAAPEQRTLDIGDLRKQALEYASQGLKEYQEYWATLAGSQKKAIGEKEHDKNKELARMADEHKHRELVPDESLLGSSA